MTEKENIILQQSDKKLLISLAFTADEAAYLN